MSELNKKIEAAKEADLKEGYYSQLSNLEYEISDLTANDRSLILEAAIEIYPKMGEYAANDLFSMASQCIWNGAPVDGAKLIELVIATVDGRGDETFDTMLQAAEFCKDPLEDQVLYHSLLDDLVDACDCDWGYSTGIGSLLESHKITASQAEKLVALSAKNSSKRDAKFASEIFERRSKYGDYR